MCERVQELGSALMNYMSQAELVLHVQNLEMNRRHYSFVGSFGTRAVRRLHVDSVTAVFNSKVKPFPFAAEAATPSQVNAVADSLGAGVYFNTMVPWRDQVCPHFCQHCAVSLHKALQLVAPLKHYQVRPPVSQRMYSACC